MNPIKHIAKNTLQVTLALAAFGAGFFLVSGMIFQADCGACMRDALLFAWVGL